jgi:hypothetical protein
LDQLVPELVQDRHFPLDLLDVLLNGLGHRIHVRIVFFFGVVESPGVDPQDRQLSLEAVDAAADPPVLSGCGLSKPSKDALADIPGCQVKIIGGSESCR